MKNMSETVNEKDWKLFRSSLPVWQESYIERIIDEYKTLLNGDMPASEKFRTLNERINRDKENPGVIISGISRSNMWMHLVQLRLNGVIRSDDLKGFSDELRERIEKNL